MAEVVLHRAADAEGDKKQAAQDHPSHMRLGDNRSPARLLSRHGRVYTLREQGESLHFLHRTDRGCAVRPRGAVSAVVLRALRP